MRVIVSIFGVARAGRVADLLEQVRQIKDVTTPEEQAVFREALASRATFQPETMRLYKEAMRRKERKASKRKLVDCSLYETKEACDTQCPEDCVWGMNLIYDREECSSPPRCHNYETREECCANAHNVYGGCVWSEKAVPQDEPRCQILGCAFGLESECSAQTGCKWHADCQGGKCTRYDYMCECDESSSICMPGDTGDDTGEALSLALDLLSCPPLECVKCLAGDPTKLEGDCKGECGGVFHCEDEASCYMKANGEEVVDGTKQCKPPQDWTGQCAAITKELADNNFEPKEEEEADDGPEQMERPSEGQMCPEICKVYNQHECNTCGGEITDPDCTPSPDGAFSPSLRLTLASTALAAYAV